MNLALAILKVDNNGFSNLCRKGHDRSQSFTLQVNIVTGTFLLVSCSNIFYSATELNWGHPTLISQSQVTFTTKKSGFGSL